MRNMVRKNQNLFLIFFKEMYKIPIKKDDNLFSVAVLFLKN
jgi:hypothetical protein